MSLRVIPCTLRKANDFIELYHRHSIRTSRDGGKFAVAVAEWHGDGPNAVCGVAIVGNPLSATLMDGFTAEVLRACVLPHGPKNCNSLLYGACRRIWFEMGGRLILTYTLDEESGASLRGAGWEMAALVKGHDSKTWGKKDHLKRFEQTVLERNKRRWESRTGPSLLKFSNIVEWPDNVEMIRDGGLFV